MAKTGEQHGSRVVPMSTTRSNQTAVISILKPAPLLPSVQNNKKK
jgi:hypothetical protein